MLSGVKRAGALGRSWVQESLQNVKDIILINESLSKEGEEEGGGQRGTLNNIESLVLVF